MKTFGGRVVVTPEGGAVRVVECQIAVIERPQSVAPQRVPEPVGLHVRTAIDLGSILGRPWFDYSDLADALE